MPRNNNESMSLEEFKKLGLHKKINKNSKNNNEILNPNLAKQGSTSKRHSKYNAKKVVIDGIEFDSTLEGKRYSVLKVMEKANLISDLKLQVRFKLVINDVLITTYIADFVYIENGKEVIEDSKGFKTPEYNIKKKLMKAIHNIDILETFK